MNNFIGKDGYNWWVGVVENIDDPLQNGRVKVRIFGWHTENLIELPTASLPWATLMNGPNASDSFSVPIPGDYVTGYFSDGMSGQNPYIVSVLPGIPAQAFDTSKGFSPQPLVPGQQAEPNAPVTPPGVVTQTVGQPTNVPISRGVVAGTGIALTNADLAHVCDFRYKFDFDIGLAGLTNPVTAITNAIKNGKNNASNFIAMLIRKLGETFQKAIKAVIAAMNLDPSGQLNVIYASLKFKLQDINDLIEDIAYYVEIASTVYYLIQDIQQIITYLNSLPDKLKKMLQDCIAQFTAGAKAFGASIAAVPGQVGASVAGLAGELQASASGVLTGLQGEVSSITIPDGLKGLFDNPTGDHANTITTYITSAYANTDTVLADANNSIFDVNSMRWA